MGGHCIFRGCFCGWIAGARVLDYCKAAGSFSPGCRGGKEGDGNSNA